jgi:hypothetical protein
LATIHAEQSVNPAKASVVTRERKALEVNEAVRVSQLSPVAPAELSSASVAGAASSGEEHGMQLRQRFFVSEIELRGR